MSIESINNKLVTVLHMDNDGWVDDKGSNDGTPSGGPLFSNTSPAPILGTYSGDFDFVDDRVSTGIVGLDITKGSFHFLWALARAGNDNDNWIPFIWGASTNIPNRFMFIKRATNTLSFEINEPTPQNDLDVSGWEIDSVHQIIGTWDNGTLKLYADEILAKTRSYTPPVAAKPNVYINSDLQLRSGGVFDEVGYFNDVLTDGGVADGQVAGGEIAELFNNGNYLILNDLIVAAGRQIINSGMAGAQLINGGVIGV